MPVEVIAYFKLSLFFLITFDVVVQLVDTHVTAIISLNDFLVPNTVNSLLTVQRSNHDFNEGESISKQCFISRVAHLHAKYLIQKVFIFPALRVQSHYYLTN